VSRAQRRSRSFSQSPEGLRIGAVAVAASAAAGVAGQPLRLHTRAGADDALALFRVTR
jgi:hypothetical protein